MRVLACLLACVVAVTPLLGCSPPEDEGSWAIEQIPPIELEVDPAELEALQDREAQKTLLVARLRERVDALKDAESTTTLQSRALASITDSQLREFVCGFLDGVDAGRQGFTAPYDYIGGDAKDQRAVVINFEFFLGTDDGELGEHEDWHAWINVEVARRLGECARFENGSNIQQTLMDIKTGQRLANARFDELTTHGEIGDCEQDSAAAVDEIVDEYCA